MKILIGCPTSDRYKYCVNLWVERVREIISFSKDIKIDYLLVDNSKTIDFFNDLIDKNVEVVKAPYFNDVKERIINSRNILKEKAINDGYDYFLSLEQDIIPDKNIVLKLLNHKKKIVSGYYSKRVILKLQDNKTGEIKNVEINMPVIYIGDVNGVRVANPSEILNKGLILIGGFGVGCVLIHREVLEKINFRYEKDKKAFDDMFFCYDAQKLGYDLYLDSEVIVEHLHKAWD